jgi:glycosyltransferase involved in cell wall biosynthesis
MRVLVVHRYFWPDKTACSTIMFSVAKHLAGDGHFVDVLTSQPSYRESSNFERCPRVEILDGIRIIRLNLPTETRRPTWRIFNAIHLGFWIFLKTLTQKYDIIIATSIPPVLGGFFSAISARIARSRFVYYCMDLHPEIGQISGDFANPFLFHLLQKIDAWNCRQADPVMVHSKDMRDTLRLRPCGNDYTIKIVNNFALPSKDKFSNLLDLNVDTSQNRLTIVYAGNIGRFQGLEVVMTAMSRIAYRKDIQLIIVGEGVARDTLVKIKLETNANVQFLSYQPVEVVKEIIRQSDIGLVSLIPNIYKYAYPSKTMTYLEQGKPIIAVIEARSELAKMMDIEGCGFSVPIDDADIISTLFLRLADDDSWKAPMSHASLKAFEIYFSPSVVLAKWSEIVEPG